MIIRRIIPRDIKHISVIKPAILRNRAREKYRIRLIICVLLSRKQELKFDLLSYLIKLMQRVPFQIVETDEGRLYDLVLGFDMRNYLSDPDVRRNMNSIINTKGGIKIYVAPIQGGEIPSMNLDAEAKIIIEKLLNKYI